VTFGDRGGSITVTISKDFHIEGDLVVWGEVIVNGFSSLGGTAVAHFDKKYRDEGKKSEKNFGAPSQGPLSECSISHICSYSIG
jgi:hypothetical protein